MRSSLSGPRMSAPKPVIAIAACVASLFHAASLHAKTVDIVIYGASSSGIIAAVQAHRMGKTVVLIEPSNHVGGLTTGGLGATDIGNKSAIGGLAREFYHRVWQYYQKDAAWNRETRDEYEKRGPRHDANDKTMWTFEPHVAAEIYQRLLAAEEITPVVNERLERQHGVKKRDARINSIRMESGRTFEGRMFI